MLYFSASDATFSDLSYVSLPVALHLAPHQTLRPFKSLFFHSLLRVAFHQATRPQKKRLSFYTFFLLIASVMSSLYKKYQPDGLFNFKRASVFCSSVALYDTIFLLTTFLFHHGLCSSMIFFLSGCLRTRGSVNCKVI